MVTQQDWDQVEKEEMESLRDGRPMTINQLATRLDAIEERNLEKAMPDNMLRIHSISNSRELEQKEPERFQQNPVSTSKAKQLRDEEEDIWDHTNNGNAWEYKIENDERHINRGYRKYVPHQQILYDQICQNDDCKIPGAYVHHRDDCFRIKPNLHQNKDFH